MCLMGITESGSATSMASRITRASSEGLTEKEKRAHARKLNMARRHLTREQKQHQIELALREDAGDSDRKIASALNVDHKTVGAVRARLVESGEIPQAAERTGVNGMKYTPPPKPVLRDADGGEVPQRLQKLFSTRPEYQRLENELREIKRRCLELAQINPVLRAHETTLKQHIDRLIHVLTASVCHAIHSDCQGEGCESCYGRGFISVGEILQRGADSRE